MKTRFSLFALIVILSILPIAVMAAPKAPEKAPAAPKVAEKTPGAKVADKAPAAEPAESTIQVSFPEKGAYIYWMEYKDMLGAKQVTAPKHVSGEDAEIDLKPVIVNGKLADGELRINDLKSGNTAVKSLKNLDGKTDLKLKDKDFDRIQTVRIVLRPTDGKPDERVESALVTLTDANSDEYTTFVDPSCEGVAEFHGIAGGAVSVVVSYEGNKRMSMDLDMPLDRDDTVYTEQLTLSSKVHTVKISGATSGTAQSDDQDKSSSKKSKHESGGSFAQYIMGFMFLGIVGLVAYVVLKAKGATFAGALNKMGVQLPQDDGSGMNIPAPASNEPQVDPNVCQFCGQRKDPTTGSCVCTINGPLGGVSTSSSSTGIPRLIGTQGQYASHIFELTGADATIGRDTGNTVPLPQDGTSSRRHARIVKENGTFVITDEGSSNGTYVNGMKITGAHPLQSGDEVQIGGTKFRFEL